MKKALTLLLKGYKKLISPYLIRSCRFHPSCSAYAIDAVEEFGAIKGSALAMWRVLRCNPFSRGGYDPAVRKQNKETI